MGVSNYVQLANILDDWFSCIDILKEDPNKVKRIEKYDSSYNFVRIKDEVIVKHKSRIYTYKFIEGTVKTMLYSNIYPTLIVPNEVIKDGNI